MNPESYRVNWRKAFQATFLRLRNVDETTVWVQVPIKIEVPFWRYPKCIPEGWSRGGWVVGIDGKAVLHPDLPKTWKIQGWPEGPWTYHLGTRRLRKKPYLKNDSKSRIRLLPDSRKPAYVYRRQPVFSGRDRQECFIRNWLVFFAWGMIYITDLSSSSKKTFPVKTRPVDDLLSVTTFDGILHVLVRTGVVTSVIKPKPM